MRRRTRAVKLAVRAGHRTAGTAFLFFFKQYLGRPLVFLGAAAEDATARRSPAARAHARGAVPRLEVCRPVDAAQLARWSTETLVDAFIIIECVVRVVAPPSRRWRTGTV